MQQHRLVCEIIEARAYIRQMEAELLAKPSGRGVPAKRATLARKSLVLEGLERAAAMVLEAEDIRVLLDDQRRQ